MLHKKYVNRGFTLVELLSVIVILAIILVIAVPKIMDVINSSKKSTLEISVKMIASTAEKTKMQNTVLGKENEEITCNSVAKLSSSDYDLGNCTITFDKNNNASVTIKGKGKLEGLTVCKGTKNEATATSSEEGCPKEQYSIVGKEWSEIVTAVKSGEYEFIVGETKEVELLNGKGTHTLRIANTTPCSKAYPTGTKGKSETACGFVLEFADVITTHNMNPSGEYNGTQYSNGWNKDGFPASSMYSYLNVVEGIEGSGTIYSALPKELRKAIIDTKVISSHGSTSGEENFTSTDKLYLLSTKDVWGSNSSNDTAASDTVTRQLDYYGSYTEGITAVTTSSYDRAKKLYGSSESWWWLRSADSSDTYYFSSVNYYGGWNIRYANASYGVSPTFRLAS